MKIRCDVLDDFNFYVSGNSQMGMAKFQAAAAIRDAAIREWSLLTSDDKISLIR